MSREMDRKFKSVDKDDQNIGNNNMVGWGGAKPIKGNLSYLKKQKDLLVLKYIYICILYILFIYIYGRQIYKFLRQLYD